jgi:hypothetical protein
MRLGSSYGGFKGSRYLGSVTSSANGSAPVAPETPLRSGHVVTPGRGSGGAGVSAPDAATRQARVELSSAIKSAKAELAHLEAARDAVESRRRRVERLKKARTTITGPVVREMMRQPTTTTLSSAFSLSLSQSTSSASPSYTGSPTARSEAGGGGSGQPVFRCIDLGAARATESQTQTFMTLPGIATTASAHGETRSHDHSHHDGLSGTNDVDDAVEASVDHEYLQETKRGGPMTSSMTVLPPPPPQDPETADESPNFTPPSAPDDAATTQLEILHLTTGTNNEAAERQQELPASVVVSSGPAGESARSSRSVAQAPPVSSRAVRAAQLQRQREAIAALMGDVATIEAACVAAESCMA